MKSDFLTQSDARTRRDVVRLLAAKFLALNFASNVSAAPAGAVKGGGKAKSLIAIHFGGGMSHVDTFDIKEKNTEANRISSPIKTNVSGIRLGKYFENLANHMDCFAMINSMQHTQGIHYDAGYLMRTAYLKRSTVVHPELGAWISKYGNRRSGDIPPFIKLGAKSGLGAGFFPGKYGALSIPDPQKGINNSQVPSGVSDERFQNRFSLTDSLNQEFEKTLSTGMTEDYHEAYTNAVKLMSSKDLEVFDLSKESEKTKARYGKNSFGYSCLLAKRLVEHGVGGVSLGSGGWDDHANIYDEFEKRARVADQGIGALMSDLRSLGLLDTTLVSLTSEFGRDAKLNKMGGRGHNPRAYTCMLAGGGIRGGEKYGASDALGQEAIDKPVSPQDFHKTIGYALGLPIDLVEMSPNGRPFRIGNKGNPLIELF